MNKKFLSKFFTGLMILVNVPFCLADTVSNPKQYDHNNASVTVDVDLDPVEFRANDGIHIATESMWVTAIKSLKADGTWEITSHRLNNEQNLDANTNNLDTRVAIAYVRSNDPDGTVPNNINLIMDFVSPDLSGEVDGDQKIKVINLLKSLIGLKFELKKVEGITETVYSTSTIDSVDDGGVVHFSHDKSPLTLTLKRTNPTEVGVEGSDKTLNLVMSLSMEDDNNSLGQAIQTLSDLETLGYRFTLQGTVQE